MDENMLLNTPIHELCNYLAQKYRTSIPILKKDQIIIDQHAAQVPLSIDRTQSRRVAGTVVNVAVPFDGDPQCFHMQPTTFTFHPPRGDVQDNFVIFQLEGVGLVADVVRAQTQQVITAIEQNLKYLQTDTNRFNGNLYSYANLLVDRQRKKALSDPDATPASGFKLKNRDADLPSDSIGEERRALTPVLPLPTQIKATPTLALKDYEQILQLLQTTSQTMRHSPSVLKTMDEAALRAYFLIQLNARFDGIGSGETFAFLHTSNICIRVDGKNIFVAECKFWAGPEIYAATLNQLLAYENWRDAKAAIMVINRDHAFAEMVDTLRTATRNHSSFKRELSQLSDTTFIYGFAPRDEPNREILLTVLAFDVP